MVERPGGALSAPVDYEGLADFLTALAYPVRLELLDKLRYPQALGDIRLTPRRGGPDSNPARPAAKQTIHAHLEKLLDADLVRTEPAPEGSREQLRYAVNPPKLYALVEELRRLSVMQASRGASGDATGTLVGSDSSATMKGPRLVLVHGAYEGKAFALDKASGPDERWLIGRKRGLAVCLDYDPFVSLENAVVAQRGREFTLTDLPGSKNGTFVNWTPLDTGLARVLRPGDVIGVGRSRLCFALD